MWWIAVVGAVVVCVLVIAGVCFAIWAGWRIITGALDEWQELRRDMMRFWKDE